VSTDLEGLRSHDWATEYRTSSGRSSDQPLNILHEFYVPALRLASSYDRVAGYFRSSSLAAASQGFSAFVDHGGKMRLIVGADLDVEDVRAIIAGDEARLARRLNDELTPKTPWPENVRNGVTLLSWMVAHAYLEVKVALRVHGTTREPLPFDSSDDGYVHEKWLVLRDRAGQRIAATGSLNESQTALVTNAENLVVFCDWDEGKDKERVRRFEADFEILWADAHRHLRVLPLPRAVEERLIRFSEGVESPVEIDGTTASPEVVPVASEPSTMERLRFAVTRDAPKMPGGRYVGLETAPVEPWPHQTMVVRRLIDTWPYAYLLCDEVGLGKTIEAGLAFRSLYLSGIVQRILVAAPASLTHQWQRQMATKMLLPFGRAVAAPNTRHEYIFPDEVSVPATSLYDADLIVISTGLLAREERARALGSARPFDIVLVDEAHAARRQNSTKGTRAHPEYGQLYRAIRDYVKPAAKSLWLATATPMQLHPVEVSDLIALTDRVGAYQFDPTLTLGYYEILGKLVRDGELNQSEWSFLQRSTKTLQVLDPFLWKYIEDNVIDGRSRMAITKWLDHGITPKRHECKLMKRVIFASAPLSRVMLRHTRPLLEIYQKRGELRQNLAKRHILHMPTIGFTLLEKQAYDDLEAYVVGLNEQLARHGDPQTRNMMQFFLSFMRLRFASSLFAIKETLKRRLEKVNATLARGDLTLSMDSEREMEGWVLQYEDEDDQDAVDSLLKGRQTADLLWEEERLKVMLQHLGQAELDVSSKMSELFGWLEERKDQSSGRIEQTVIFTRFYDTLTDIVRRLRFKDSEMRIGTYSGRGAGFLDPHTRQMVGLTREAVKELFLRGEIDVLVCTDAAAEGLNLQTADLLVNFDLGWNPMKVEQRIGRIDRIGQRHADIYVLNLCYAESAEATVYGRLWERLQEAHTVVGSQQASVLPITAEHFQQLTEGELTAEELMQEAEAALAEQQRRTASMEMSPDDLYEIYTRFQGQKASSRAPVDRAAIWKCLTESAYLHASGCRPIQLDGYDVLKVDGIGDVTDGAFLTISPELYDRGLPRDQGRLHFASYGDPVFDTIIHKVCDYELPACVRRLAVSLDALPHAEIIAYAVLCQSAEGVTEVCLIESWDDVVQLEAGGRVIAEEESLTDRDIAPLKEQLLQRTRMEFVPHVIASELEKENIISGKAQQLLNVCVIQELLEVRATSVGSQGSFHNVLRAVETLSDERPSVQVPLEAEIFRPVQDKLLFDIGIPSVGRWAALRTPPLLRESAMDAARVIEDRAKTSKGAMPYKAMVARLRQEATQLKLELERMV
jgi:superfamily II DNA or RNA helicase